MKITARFLAGALLAIFAGALSERASAEERPATPPKDCALLADLLAQKGDTKLSVNSYGADCDWNSLKAAVTLVQPYNNWTTFVMKPNYAADGLSADVEYGASFIGDHQRGTHSNTCHLERRDARWTVIGCKLHFIAD